MSAGLRQGLSLCLSRRLPVMPLLLVGDRALSGGAVPVCQLWRFYSKGVVVADGF